MTVRNVLGPFNRYVANITEVMPLKNNPLNAVLFLGTTASMEPKQHSGAISLSEIEEISNVKALTDKIKIGVSQRDGGGNPILPTKFFTAGIDISSADATKALEYIIKVICVDKEAQAVTVVFDTSKTTLAKVGFLEEVDTILNNWDSWAILGVDTIAEIREPLKTTSRVMLIKNHKDEDKADAALAGRVIFMGVGKVDGVAKELYGVTADKLSIMAGDGGDLTASEAQTWVEANVNLYVQTVDMLNETDGMRFLSGKEFINNWELTKVKLDLRNDLVQLRNENDRMGVSAIDEAIVRGTIVNRLETLKINAEDPELNPNGILVDYIVKPIPLDRTLEDNIFKFKFEIKVSLSGVLKYFDLGITGYTDGRVFEVTGGDE